MLFVGSCDDVLCRHHCDCLGYSGLKAEVTISINDLPHKLILRGNGVCDPQEVNAGDEYFPKTDKLNQLNPAEVFFSKSQISIGPIKPKSTLKDVFFINNNTNDIISFMFLSTRMTEVVQLRVMPPKGLVQPGSSVECRLACHGCGWPSCIEVTLTCAHANFTQYAASIKTLNKYYEDLVSSLSNFSITEKGLQPANVTPPADIWPAKNYLTIGVNIDVKERSAIADDDILPPCPAAVEPRQDDVLEMEEENKLLIIEILERLLWEVLDESYHKIQSAGDGLEVHYEQIKDLEIQVDMRVPDHLTQNILEDVLHTAWQDVFQLCGYRNCELFRRRLINQTTHESRITRHSSSSGIPTVTSVSDSFLSIMSERLRLSSKKSQPGL